MAQRQKQGSDSVGLGWSLEFAFLVLLDLGILRTIALNFGYLSKAYEVVSSIYNKEAPRNAYSLVLDLLEQQHLSLAA